MIIFFTAQLIYLLSVPRDSLFRKFKKMAKIEVKSSSLIRMASNSASISRIELTPWDLQLLLLDPIQKGILFYKPLSHQTLIDHLKNSLSRTLDFFPPLAGRLASVQNDDGTVSFFVDCNNAGVQFVHASAGAVSISDILDPTYKPEIIFNFFTLNGIPSYEGVSKPLLGVQLTELVDGLFIACTANHCVIDGISFWHFFNSWSEISRGCESISKLPIFKPWFPPNAQNSPIHLPPFEQNQVKNFAPPPLLERVFHFSKESLSKLKSKANSEAGNDKISTLQALSTHLWWCITRCRHSLRNLSSEEAGFVMMIGGRGRIPLPDGYFGNAVIAGWMTINVDELLQKGFGYVALKINELVAKQTKESIIESAENWVRNPRLLRKANLTFIISSSPRHNVYGNDFGWGKPIAVRSGKATKFDGKITVFPAAVAGGIDAEVCLAPETMQALEGDTEFMEAFAV